MAQYISRSRNVGHRVRPGRAGGVNGDLMPGGNLASRFVKSRLANSCSPAMPMMFERPPLVAFDESRVFTIFSENEPPAPPRIISIWKVLVLGPAAAVPEALWLATNKIFVVLRLVRALMR